ncbi:hypothetical protein QZH41_008377 [Actinostola sp. cb2023]|nr:hypothetical protein QZH41_008377 [Actinostola sp. cb2023]
MTSPVERKIETLTDTQRRRKVTWEELYTHLYGHHDIETVDPEEIRKNEQEGRVEPVRKKLQIKFKEEDHHLRLLPSYSRMKSSCAGRAYLGLNLVFVLPVPSPQGHGLVLMKIYKEGRFSHYVNGEDERTSSWMRYIQCARYKEEQNMTVFQYCGNIYYRAYRHIPAGREMLVWYDEKYSELLDIPALMKVLASKGQFLR